jgi:hypothetical protein
MQTKQHAQQGLAPRRQARAHHDGHGKHDQQQVGQDVTDGDGQQVRVALPAAAARVRRDLPVVGGGLALGKVGDDDGEEGGGQQDAGDAQEQGVAVLARGAGEAVEEFEGDDLEEPEAARVVSNLRLVW